MYESMKQMLDGEYGIRELSLQEIPSGWSASAWKVHSGCGDYFLKVYDKRKPSAKSWIARIDSYMPVVLWLHGNTELRSKMTAPILAGNGSYKIEDEAYLYMVFPFIDGQTICDEKLRPEQTRTLARIVSELHSYGAEIPVPINSLKETFDVSFCMTLIDRLGNMHDPSLLNDALAPHMDALARTAASLQETAALLRNSKVRYVLCHTDIHGWNLMQAESLVLIDWEGLKLAPAEADLFSFTGTFFFEYAWEDFISVYRAARKGYRVNADAMRFYRLRRRLEDIDAFVESILFDNLAQDELNRSLYYLRRECELLNATR